MRHHSSYPMTAILGAALSAAAGAQISFGPGTGYPANTRPEGIAFGDFDGDGDRDMAVTTDDPDKISVYTNAGDGTFSGPVSVPLGGGTSPHALVASDFDGDGDVDLAVSLANSNAVRLVTNDGAGNFTPGATTAVGGVEPRSMAGGDVDGDGDVDLVVSNRESNDVSVLRNAGGSFSLLGPFAAGAEPRKLDLAHLDGNGTLDVVVSAHDDRDVNILLGNGSGSFALAVSLSVGPQLRPDGAVAADLDGDGDMDVAAATGDDGTAQFYASVFLNQGGGSWTGPFHYPSGGIEPDAIVAADFDLDGDVDLATSNQNSNTVGALPNQGGGTFGAATLLSTGARPGSLAAGDLNGDGSPDLAVASRDSNDVQVFLNDASAGDCPVSVYCDTNPDNSADISIDTCSCAAGSIQVGLTNAAAPDGNFGYLLVGAGNGTVTDPPGAQGDLCLIGRTIGRYNKPADLRVITGGSAAPLDVLNAASGGGGGGIPTIGGNLCSPSGQTWNFQWWYRNGMNPSRFSKAMTVTFRD